MFCVLHSQSEEGQFGLEIAFAGLFCLQTPEHVDMRSKRQRWQAERASALFIADDDTKSRLTLYNVVSSQCSTYCTDDLFALWVILKLWFCAGVRLTSSLA